MSGAAQREEIQDNFLATGTDGATALRQIAAERLAAHRSRRAVVDGLQAQRELALAQEQVRQQARKGSSRVKDVVAARYQESVSYREFLAAEARHAIEKAQAEAEVAARNAAAVAETQRQLLAEIEHWNQPAAEVLPEPLMLVEAPSAPSVVAVTPKKTVAESLKVQLYAERAPQPSAMPQFRDNAFVSERLAAPEELAELDQEIAFRLAPEFQQHVVETTPIPANILEFPRQLVASRKARPRLAEGPLREDGTPEPQLRIFEVEPEQISVAPAFGEATGAPEWQGLLLATAPMASVANERHVETEQATIQLHAAPISRRILAATVDAACLGVAMVGFVTVVSEIAGPALRALTLPLLGGSVAGTLAVFVLLYKLLFFTLNEATPGMRYARVAFCTFRDSNPTRSAMRRRLLSTALATCPLGMGLMWIAMDGDRMGWHDRMSRMYPRAY
jgi:hypothetical protein